MAPDEVGLQEMSRCRFCETFVKGFRKRRRAATDARANETSEEFIQSGLLRERLAPSLSAGTRPQRLFVAVPGE